jgi:hypothetical protein
MEVRVNREEYLTYSPEDYLKVKILTFSGKPKYLKGFLTSLCKFESVEKLHIYSVRKCSINLPGFMEVLTSLTMLKDLTLTNCVNGSVVSQLFFNMYLTCKERCGYLNVALCGLSLTHLEFISVLTSLKFMKVGRFNLIAFNFHGDQREATLLLLSKCREVYSEMYTYLDRSYLNELDREFILHI